MTISKFVDHHYRHFNAAALRDAAIGYRAHLDGGGRMLMTLAGAMSTGELGLSLAEMIRQEKVHAIACTGANLEEDLFNLVAHTHYERIPQYRDLTREDEVRLLEKGANRVTDTCIPEDVAIRRIEAAILEEWKAADRAKTARLPHEFFYDLVQKETLKEHYEIDPRDSWLVAAAERNLPLIVPGWEDSTLGNIFASHVIRGTIASETTVRSGIGYMRLLAGWYQETSRSHPTGFFQIGGGIAGDFPICVVPMLRQDMEDKVPLWKYFCQISDSTTSYGSYSGAVPNEKITWGKLGVDSVSHVIESDATIVAPLVFAYVLGW
jgi:deoxyhypusine synthase